MEMNAFASIINDAAELNTIPDKQIKSSFIVDTEKNGRFLVCLNIRKLKEKKKRSRSRTLVYGILCFIYIINSISLEKNKSRLEKNERHILCSASSA
jgi:hypothetical protein